MKYDYFHLQDSFKLFSQNLNNNYKKYFVAAAVVVVVAAAAAAAAAVVAPAAAAVVVVVAAAAAAAAVVAPAAAADSDLSSTGQVQSWLALHQWQTETELALDICLLLLSFKSRAFLDVITGSGTFATRSAFWPNSKHRFTTSFLQPLPYLVTP